MRDARSRKSSFRNRSHLNVEVSPELTDWKLNLHWELTGEFLRDFRKVLRESGETALQNFIDAYLRSQIHVIDLKPLGYRLLDSRIELNAEGSLPREKVNDQLELIHNGLWRSESDLPRYILRDRTDSILLPAAGEISATYHIKPGAGLNVGLPASVILECDPLQYSVLVWSDPQEVRIEEKILSRDLRVPSGSFPEFGEFPDQYYHRHSWTLLFSTQLAATTPESPKRFVYVPFSPKTAPGQKPLAAQQHIEACTDAAVEVTGRLKYGKLFLDVRNLTLTEIDECVLTLYYANDETDYSVEEPVAHCAIGPRTTQHFFFKAGRYYTQAEASIRFSQKGTWHECGPFTLSVQSEP